MELSPLPSTGPGEGMQPLTDAVARLRRVWFGLVAADVGLAAVALLVLRGGPGSGAFLVPGTAMLGVGIMISVVSNRAYEWAGLSWTRRSVVAGSDPLASQVRAVYLGFQMAQAGALLGFVASMLDHEMFLCLAGVALTLEALALQWPRAATFGRWTLRAGGASEATANLVASAAVASGADPRSAASVSASAMSAQGRKMTMLTCLALWSMPVLLGFVVWITVTDPAGLTREPAEPVVLAVFAVVSLAASGSAWFVRDLLAGRIVRSARVAQNPAMVQGMFLLPMVTGMALGEIPALMGFVLAILTSDWRYYAAFATLTVIHYLFMWPRDSVWERYQRMAETPSIPGIS